MLPLRLTIFLVCASLLAQAQKRDSLIRILPQLPDSEKVLVLGDLAFGFRFENSDTALHFAQQSRIIADQLGKANLIARSLNDEGIVLAGLARYEEALDNYNRALDIRRELQDSIRLGALHSKIGVIHQKQGAYNKAIEHQLAALRLFQALSIDNYTAICQNNVAILHLNMGDLERSLEMHEQALATRKRIGDEHGEASSYSNIGNVYLALGDTTRAAANYASATEIFEGLQDPEGLSTNLHNWATCFQRTDPEMALALLSRALEIRERMGDEKMLASTHASIGATLLSMERFSAALPHLRQALTFARHADVLVEQLSVYENLATLYRELGNADSTYKYFALYQSVKDSAFSDDLRKDFAELQMHYETEQKESDIALLREQNKVKDLQVQQSRTQIGLLGIGFVAFVFIAVMFYFRYRERQQARLSAGIMREREAGLKAVIAATEAERERIARNLHDGVGQQLSGLKMGWQQLLSELQPTQSTTKEKSEKLTEVLDEACDEVRSISHRMMPRSLGQYGLVPAIGDLLEKSIHPAGITFDFETLGLDQERFDSELELSVYRVMQELVNNILKHAEATHVSVQLVKNSGYLIAVIEDNGKGFDPGVQSDGIGLKNMQGRLDAVNGIIHFERDSGTRATIRIKLAA